MNTTGVPCTIGHLMGESIKYEAPKKNTIERMQDRFEMKSLEGDTKRFISELEAEIQSSKLSKKTKLSMLGKLNIIQGRMSGSAEHYITLVKERIKKTTLEAKAELEAFKTHLVTSLGFEKLSELRELLGKGKEED